MGDVKGFKYGLKEIKNWGKATIFDIESDGFLREATKIYILGYRMYGGECEVLWGDTEEERIKAFFQHHIDNEIPLAAHNAIGFDKPLVEKLYGMDLSELMVIDTLALSWVLNTRRRRHSLEALAEEYDAGEKFEVDSKDWVSLTREQAVERVTSDVEINYALYEDFKERLIGMYTNVKHSVDNVGVGGSRISPDEVIYLDGKIGQSVDEWINQYLSFLMFKMDCAALKEKTMWEVDVEQLEASIEEFEGMVEAIKDEVESVMPRVPKYTNRKQPSRMNRKDGSLSVAGERWQRLRDLYAKGEKDEQGNPLVTFENGQVKELTGMSEPNLNSHVQVKDFLFANGWNPCTFETKRDDKAFQEWVDSKPEEGSHYSMWQAWKESRPEDRLIPQITQDGEDGKELTDSVQELADKIPEVAVYANYSTITHRLSVLKGFRDNLKDGKWLQARIGGFTNTLRSMHREIGLTVS